MGKMPVGVQVPIHSEVSWNGAHFPRLTGTLPSSGRMLVRWAIAIMLPEILVLFFSPQSFVSVHRTSKVLLWQSFMLVAF